MTDFYGSKDSVSFAYSLNLLLRIGEWQVRSGFAAISERMKRFTRDTRGSQSLEFALVAMPFLSLLFGIFAICLYFFTAYTLENSLWEAARDLRTGRYQTGQGVYANLTGKDLQTALKTSICSRAPGFINCTDQVRVFVQSTPDFAKITRPDCLKGDGSLVENATAENGWNVGGASSVVLVTVCYSWAMAAAFPFLDLGDMPDGSKLIQASAAFRTEPYAN